MILQNPEDLDSNQWLDEGELTELPQIPIEEAEMRVRGQAKDSEVPELYTGPNLDILILPEDPELLAEREGKHKRIQAEMQNEDKEAEFFAEEMLEAPLAWNEVPNLIMEVEEGKMMPGAAVKRRREEVAQGRRKQWREDR